MEKREGVPCEADRARHRLLSYYHHLFPELAKEWQDGVEPPAHLIETTPTVALDPAFDLPPLAVHKGWTSQPEEFDYELEVEGELPPELHGTLFRNGPGLLEVYGTPLVHPIDGDGMVCSIKFANGSAHFRSKYVKTTGYVMEKKAHKLIFKGMMGTKPSPTWGEALSEWSEDIRHSKLPNQRFKNPSNTNVYYWGGKLLATWESGLPYGLDPVTLETRGKETLGGVLKESRCLAAHFRYDPFTDRLVTFSFQLAMSGSCKLFIYEFDRQWQLLSKQVHSFESYYYCHDFMLTEHYYIFHHTPFYKLSKANVAKIISGASAPGKLMRYYPDVPSRMILIPRDGKTPSRFFDTEPCMIYHHCNAWEEDHKVHFSSVCLGEKFNMDFDQGMWLSNASVAPGIVHNYTIDLLKDTMVRTKADFSSCEFPSVHPGKAGKRWRYAYLMASDSPAKPIPYQEVVKFDREGQNRQVWSAREEFSTLGEPVFVPRPGSDRDEDDGWVIAQLYNCKLHRTQFVVLDAKVLGRGPIARVKLNHHTPYGFHGTFTPEVFY